MSRSLLIIAALALTTGACTIHRHYHQAPEGPYAQAPELASRQPAPEAQDPDQPLPPEYAKPGFDDGYTSYGYDRSDDDDGYGRYNQYDRYEHRCECDHQRRAPRRSAPAPAYRRHPGPVVPDNPVEWLE